MNTFALLLISEIIFQFGNGMLGPLLAIFVRDIGGGDIMNVGIAYSLFLFTTGIMAIFFGKLSDKYGRKKLIIIGSVLSLPVPFAYMFVDSMSQIAVIQIWSGIGLGITWAPWMAMLSDVTEKSRRGFLFGVYAAAFTIMPGLGALIGSSIVKNFGFRTMFFIIGVLNILSTGILFGIKEARYGGKKRQS